VSNENAIAQCVLGGVHQDLQLGIAWISIQ